MKTPFQIACLHYGLKEVPGKENNPVIMSFFNTIGHSWVQGDETAWCAAFANYCCLASIGKQTGKLTARSFLNFGIDTTEPFPGDIVIIWRESPDSWKGHVGFYINHDNEYVYMLGGNQNNQVNVSRYPVERVLVYKRAVL